VNKTKLSFVYFDNTLIQFNSLTINMEQEI